MPASARSAPASLNVSEMNAVGIRGFLECKKMRRISLIGVPNYFGSFWRTEMNFRSFEPNNPRGANSTLASDFIRSLPSQPDPSLVIVRAFCLPESAAFNNKRLGAPPHGFHSSDPPFRQKTPPRAEIGDKRDQDWPAGKPRAADVARA